MMVQVGASYSGQLLTCADLSKLRRLLHENGEAGYLEKWGEDRFPIAETRDLEEAG